MIEIPDDDMSHLYREIQNGYFSVAVSEIIGIQVHPNDRVVLTIADLNWQWVSPRILSIEVMKTIRDQRLWSLHFEHNRGSMLL